MKKSEGWLKEPNFKRNSQKKALHSPIGSKGVKNREKYKKIGLKKPEGWLKSSKIHQKWVKNGGKKGYVW
jgi:hypothetical protein